MILENLLVNNFGVYNGKQNFNLSTDKKKPVILIGALNGSGKTTFLHSIDFVLYGKQSNIFKTSKLSYENFLKENINKENFDQGAQIELVFYRKEKGKKKVYKISRSWKQIGSKIKEEFFVFVNSIYDEDITKDWDNYVDQILPSRVASLFFFDGEKIEQLADLDKSKEVLKKAIDSLLGLEIVDQLNLDVEEFKRRSGFELKSDKDKEKIESLEQKVLEHEKEIKVIDEDIIKHEDELAKIKYDKQQIDIELSKKGFAYYEKKKELEKDIAAVNKDKKEVKDELIKLAAGDPPLLLLKDELRELLDQSKSINDQKNFKEILENKKKVLSETKEFVSKYCNDNKFLEKFDKFIKDKVKNNISLPKVNEDKLNYQELDFLFNSQMPKLSNEISSLIKKFNEIDELYEKKIVLLNKVPANEEIEPLLVKNKEITEQEGKIVTKINVLEGLRSSKRGPLKLLKRDIKLLYDDKAKGDLINLDKRRFVDYSLRVKDILSSFHVKVLDHHIKRLEKYILEAFNNLHRKKGFVKTIKVDTSNFDLKIYEKKNKEIDTEKLSAGERQLLAVAILWGLAKASKSAAPTIIDTPLGRLDSEHRLNLVEQYFPLASNQVILLSTDEEINKKYHKYIKPFLARSYKIEFDQKINGSKLKEGYFF